MSSGPLTTPSWSSRTAPSGGPGGEIVFIHYNGPGPRKERRTPGILGQLAQVSVPEYVQTPFRASGTVLATRSFGAVSVREGSTTFLHWRTSL